MNLHLYAPMSLMIPITASAISPPAPCLSGAAFVFPSQEYTTFNFPARRIQPHLSPHIVLEVVNLDVMRCSTYRHTLVRLHRPTSSPYVCVWVMAEVTPASTAPSGERWTRELVRLPESGHQIQPSIAARPDLT